MDPMFGLPCVQDSRAMDSARTRNQSQEKLLAEKFESLDLDMKFRSGQLLSKKNEIEDFMSRLDASSSRQQVQLPAGLTQRERAMYRKIAHCAGVTSIPLAEFDRLWKQKASHARHRVGEIPETGSFRDPGIHLPRDVRRSKRLTQTEASDHKDVDIIGKTSLVATDDLELCLPMNRQKHAVRDVWSRITSEDMRHKTALKKTISASSVTARSQQRAKEVIRYRHTEKTQEHRTQDTKSDQKFKRR